MIFRGKNEGLKRFFFSPETTNPDISSNRLVELTDDYDFSQLGHKPKYCFNNFCPHRPQNVKRTDNITRVVRNKWPYHIPLASVVTYPFYCSF